MPEGVRTLAYADDLAILVKLANDAMERVARWMDANHLALAPEKTEATLLIGTKRCGELEDLCLRDFRFKPKTQVKYLGVILDQCMTFAAHIQEALGKAQRTVAALRRLMPRTRGPAEGKRRLLATVATSIALYAAPARVSALEKKRNVNRMLSVQRGMAIGVCRAYRTADTQGVLVIARRIPWHLAAQERTLRYQDRRQTDPTMRSSKRERREATIAKWQQEWRKEAEGGQWTRRMIPDLTPWVNRRHGQTSYHLTQIPTGHGCFEAYLDRMRLAQGAECPLCMTGDEDTPQHTLSECEYFGYERKTLMEKIGAVDRPEDVISAMLKAEEHWSAAEEYADVVMSTKEVLERDRKRRATTRAPGSNQGSQI